jgi:hypothetical protein
MLRIVVTASPSLELLSLTADVLRGTGQVRPLDPYIEDYTA